MTIRHIVAWKLAAQDDATRAEQAAEISRLLHTLPSQISDLRSLEVGVNVLKPGDNADVVLTADFDDEDALGRYATHPEHLKVAAYIRSVVGSRLAVDYRIAQLLGE
ncbi:MAG: Dabb family protein [Microbacteriaceae bacterium]|nr:MAG: Dabb family protein [Microbacteriaceae bacterium]